MFSLIRSSNREPHINQSLSGGFHSGQHEVLIEKLHLSSVLRMGQLALSLLALAGMISMVLGLYFSEYLWSYLAGSFLQASVGMMALVATNVLFFEPLADCAGMAASFEIVAQSILPSLLSAIGTQSMIQVGPKGLTLWQAGACVAGGVLFWLGYGCNPPAWTLPLEPSERPKSLRLLADEAEETS